VSITGLANGVFDVTAAQMDADTTFDVGTNTKLIIDADDASGRAISGSGNLQVLDLSSGTDLTNVVSGVGGDSLILRGDNSNVGWSDLPELNGTITFTVNTSDGASARVYTSAPGNDSGWLTLTSGSTYTVPAKFNGYSAWFYLNGVSAQLTISSFSYNNGTDTTEGFQGLFSPNSEQTFATGDVQFGVGASGLTSVEAVIATGGVDITNNEYLDAVTTYTVDTGRSFTLEAEQATGRTVNAAGAVLVELDSTAFDLTGIQTQGQGSFTATAQGLLTLDDTANLGAVESVTVLNSGTLTLSANQANGLTIPGTDAESVVVTALEESLGADLSGLAAGLTTSAQLNSTGDVELGDSADLTNVDTITISGNGTVTAHIDAVLGSGTYSVGEDATLSLTAVQAHLLRAIGTGTVEVSGLEVTVGEDTFADLSELDATTLTAAVDVAANTVVFTGNLGNAEVSITGTTNGVFDVTAAQMDAGATFDVGEYTTLKIKGSDIDQRSVNGLGAVQILDFSSGTDLQYVVAGEAAPTPITGFTEAFSPNQWNITEGNSGNVEFNGEANVLTLTGLAEEGWADASSVSAIIQFAAEGTVSVNYNFAQQGSEYFEYFDGDAWIRITTSGSGTLSLNANDLRFYVRSDDADWEELRSASVLTLTEFSYTPSGGVPGLAAVEAIVASGGVDITGENVSAITTYTVLEDRSLTLDALQVTGRTVDAAGAVLVELDSTAFDLTGIQTQGQGSFTATAQGLLTLDDTANLGAVESVTVLEGGSLTLSADQANGLTILGTDAESVVVTALEDTQGANLSGLAEELTTTAELDSTGDVELGASANLTNVDTINISGNGTVTADNDAVLGSGSYSVGTDATLSLTAAQAHQLQATGNGSVLVQATTFTSETDLRSIDSLGLVFNSGEGPSTALEVTESGVLTLNSARVGPTGAAVTAITGTGDVILDGLASNSDFSGVDAALSVTIFVTTDVNVSENENLHTVDEFVVDQGVTLEIKALQIAGDTLSGAGTLVLVAGGTFTGNLDIARVEVASNQTLTISAAQASNQVIAGQAALTSEIGGSIVITGLDGNAAYDLSNVSAGPLGEGTAGSITSTIAAGTLLDVDTLLGTIALEVLNDGTHASDLTLTAAQASGRTITGAADLVITNGEVTTAYDFSTIAANNDVSLEFTNAGTINASTVLTNVDVINLASGVTTLTAAQANGVSFAGSAVEASVRITGSDGVQALVGTTGNDVISTGTGLDIVDITQGGSDTLVFSGDAEDMNITGFLGGSGDGADVLDFSAITGLTSNSYKAYNSVQDNDPVRDPITGIVAEFADSAINVQSIFAQAGGFLNSKIDSASPTNMIFLISNSAQSSVGIWHWQDAEGLDTNVQANELTLLGKLLGENSTSLTNYDSSNFLV
jgi:hypothetical protein